MPNNCVADWIETRGFGPAQLCVAILAYGVWIGDGMELTMITVLAGTIEAELNISGTQLAALASIVFLGIGCGCPVSGYLGDNFGRRPAIFCSYALVVCFGILIVFASSFPVLLVLRFLLGFAMGIGMPASLALVNEISPIEWRVPLMGMRGIVYSIGSVFALTVLIIDDPTFTHLHWRACILTAVVPAVVFGVVSFALLPESPVFLEAIGRHDDAKKVLAWIVRCNDVSQLDTDVPSFPTLARGSFKLNAAHSSWWTQICTVFSRHLAFSTAIMIMSAFTMNFFEYGLSYAEPYVFQNTNASLAAGWQLFYKYLVNMIMRCLVIVPAVVLSRRVALISTLTIGIIGVILFAYTGAISERDPLEVVLYYCGQYVPQISALGYLIIFQVSVEIYPTWVASTGSGFIVGAGRAGTILAPFVFEFVRSSGWSWQVHYYIIAILCGITAILASGLDNLEELTMAARDGAMNNVCALKSAQV